MKLSCIVIEDEPLAMDKTCGFIAKVPYLNLLAKFDNAINALAFLKSGKADLMFLDIKMDELSGIQLLEKVQLNIQVILTTAYDEYALKGYELNITDYLLKPFTFDRFLQAVEKAQNNIARLKPSEKEFIFIKTEYRLEKLMLEDILYIEGMRDYRKIVTLHKPIMTLQTFAEFEKEIPSTRLCRVHKSYMVALNKIESVERDRIRIGNTTIPVSDTYKELFYQQIS